MFDFFKIVLLCHFITISVKICASKSIDHGVDSDLRLFFYFKDFPDLFTKIHYLQKNPFLKDTEILKYNQSTITSLEYYAEEKTFFWTSSNGELSSTTWLGDENKVIPSDENRDKDQDDEDISNIIFNVLIKDNNKLLHSEKDWYPRSMALDDVGKKLYIVDSYERSIDVFDLDGKNKARIFTSDYLIPYEIAVDPSEGLLFLYGINFLKRKSELHRMNMDGSDHQLIIDTIENLKEVTLRLKANLVLDREHKQLYYKASSNNIATVDYNGRGGDLILRDQNVEYFGIYKNRLLWTKQHFKEDSFIGAEEFKRLTDGYDWQYPLWSCELNNQTHINSSISCGPISEIKTRTKDYRMNAFKIFDFTPRKKPANPCLQTNNSCEDHCLLKSTGVANKLSFGCVCRLGRKINDDNKTCSNISAQKTNEDSIPYVFEKVLFLYNSSTESSTKNGTDKYTIYKISSNFAQKLSHGGSDIAWDDTLNDKYTVNGQGQLIKYQNDEYHVIRNSPEFSDISPVLTYDWVSKNLYYAVSTKFSNDEYNLFVIDTKHPEKEIFLGQIAIPRSMAVHPYRGYVFIATYGWCNKKSQIVRYNTDGKDRLVLFNSKNKNVRLALDMVEDRIYWTDKCYKRRGECVMSSNLDGSDPKILLNSRYRDKIAMIGVYEDNIYLKAEKSYRDNPIHVYNKSGELIAQYPLGAFDVGLNNVILTKQKVKKIDTQYLSVKNPCAYNNGGCEFFCFAVPTNSSENLQKVCSN